MVRLFNLCLACVPLFCFGSTIGHIDTNDENHTFPLKKGIDKINLDGYLNEASWADASIVTDFWMKYPTNETKASTKTEVKLTYDDGYLYVGIKAYEDGNTFILPSLKRDKGLMKVTEWA